MNIKLENWPIFHEVGTECEDDRFCRKQRAVYNNQTSLKTGQVPPLLEYQFSHSLGTVMVASCKSMCVPVVRKETKCICLSLNI